MTRGRTQAHRATLVVALGLALTACSPQTDPVATPTPTGFTSEEEAFAAAEATYRAYIDALNEARRGATDVAPESYLIGQALADSDQASRLLLDRGWRIEGPSRMTKAALSWWDESGVTVAVCLDSGSTRVIDEAGADVTPDDRAVLIALEVRMIWSPSHPLITTSEVSESGCSS